MAFDPERHELDPITGFAIDKQTGARVGLDPLPHVSTHEDPEYPKWVEAHSSHVERRGDVVSTPAFPLFHVNRVGGAVMVLVHDADEEAKATSAPAPAEPAAPEGDAA